MERYVPPLSEPARRWVRFLGLIAAIVACVWLVRTLSGVFTPIALGMALAYIFNPVVVWIDQRVRLSRLSIVVIVFLAIGGSLLVGLVWVAGVSIIQFQFLQERLPDYLRRIGAWLESVGVDAPSLNAITRPSSQPGDGPRGVEAWWRAVEPLIKTEGTASITAALQTLTRLAASVTTIATLLVLLPMYTFFFLWKFDAILKAIRDHLPSDYRGAIVHVAAVADASMANFFRGRLGVCFGVGVLNSVGWTIVGVPYSVPLGILSGVLNMVPFMQIACLPLALLSAYVEAGQNWLWPVALTMGVYLAVQAIESFLLSPLIEGQASGLHPVLIVVVLLIGAELAGLLGMLLAIPITSTLLALAKEWILPEIRRLAAAPPGGSV